MLTEKTLRTIAKARLGDALVLAQSERYDGAIYLSGYAIEISLKARICKTLNWTEYPSKGDYQSFRTHKFEVLLHLSGIENKIKTKYLADWSEVIQWNPDARYKAIGTASKDDADSMIDSVKSLLDGIVMD